MSYNAEEYKNIIYSFIVIIIINFTTILPIPKLPTVRHCIYMYTYVIPVYLLAFYQQTPRLSHLIFSLDGTFVAHAHSHV